MKRLLWIFLFISTGSLFGQTADLTGQASLWGVSNDQTTSQIGIRYIPALSLAQNLSNKWIIDSEIAWQCAKWWQFENWRYQSEAKKLKPYRMWLRISTDQFEARLGLQKINFGSARLIRPLMWFDRLDPRDPLQLTDGVNAILMKYTFLNNANIWAWGLYGNEDIKGYEILPTQKNTLEFGGRFQYPLPSGEIALTMNQRRVKNIESLERRIAFDGRWDIEIGIWLELTLTHLEWDRLPYQYQTMGTLGLDYTFGIGNGFYCQAEHFTFRISDKWSDPGTTRKLTALSLNYPLGLIDNLITMIYYDWDEHDLYRFINWQRTYDSWQIHLIGFWNPEQFQLIQFQTGQSLWMGKGIQCMVVFNH
ncbi:hypothetical protein JW835_05020 [bacterium]|nr:hypothetical protein [bacterium]